jgi:hypothetical protein
MWMIRASPTDPATDPDTDRAPARAADAVTAQAGVEPTPDPPGGPAGRREPPERPARPADRAARWRPVGDVAVCAALSLAAIVLTHGLLAHPNRRALALNPGDQALVEWLLAAGTRLWTGDLHLVTTLLNAPDGVNLLSNASMLALGVLLTPVTLAFGAPVSFAVAVAGNLAATGIGWYLLFSRTLRLRRVAAATGAAFCAYAPGMIAQSNAHLHMTAQWLVPAMVWAVVRLARSSPTRPVRIALTGLSLGALICVQLFLGEEVLLLTAATLGLFCLAYAALAPRRAARAAPGLLLGLAMAAGLALVVLSYPLWLQFAGPQHIPNGPFTPSFFVADLAGFWSVAPQSWGGSPHPKLASGAAEYNTFFGTALIVVVVVATAWLWRHKAVLAAVIASLVMGALALGPTVTVGGTPTDHTGPYALLAGLPVVDGALPTRFALPLIPIIAFVLATAVDRALRHESRAVQLAVPAVVALAVLPLVPMPLPTTERPAVPRFFTGGGWRTCVKPGGTLVPVPVPNPGDPDKMRWAAAADARFAIPEGFFIGPYAAGGRASIGIFSRPTSQLLNRVFETGTVPPVTPDDRAQAQQDVAYWHASCLVLATNGTQFNVAALGQTMTLLFGPGRPAEGVTVWRVG